MQAVVEYNSLVPKRSRVQICKRYAIASTFTQVVEVSNPEPAKSYPALQTVHHNFNLRRLGAITQSWTPQTRYTLRHIMGSIMKG